MFKKTILALGAIVVFVLGIVYLDRYGNPADDKEMMIAFLCLVGIVFTVVVWCASFFFGKKP